MDTKIKTDLFAKQLRARLAQLKEARPRELAAYHDAVNQWRLDLARWIQEHGGKRVLSATPMKSRERYFGDRAGFSTDDFFRGSPLPPEYPDDKVIREIQVLLRQLGITGQATVTVSTGDVARLLEGAPLKD